MIVAKSLRKEFSAGKTPVLAVRDLDLEVGEGEVFGFLGPNGAGKTTTIRMLACLIRPTSGSAWLGGMEVGSDDTRIRSQIGILTESPGLYERMSVERNLEVYARLYGVDDVDARVHRYLSLLELWDRRDAPAGTLSKGMKQKLAIARAMLHEPGVLFLDEPTSALDPRAAKTVRDFIAQLSGQGRTIFLCTHNLDEAERLCDRIAVFNQRLVALDTPDALRRMLFGRQTTVRIARHDESYVQALAALPFVERIEAVAAEDGSGEIVLTIDDPLERNPVIVHVLVGRGADVQSVVETKRSLEDVYLSLVRAPDGEAP